MWTRTYSQHVRDVPAAQLWKVWTDVDRWPEWQGDVAHARLEGDFAAGQFFRFQPKGGPRLRIELTEVVPGRRFVDVTRFPLARMVDSHELVPHPDGGVEVKTTLMMQGPLSFLWSKVVGEDVAASLPQQTSHLVERARAHG
jgi:uncharacterized protein YndB with AHSA1/START domain